MQLLAFAALATSSVAVLAANYPLELVSPRAVGTAPASGNAAIGAANRIFKAYPGIEYNIRAIVIGGAYPYTFSLANAPSGMTINENTGEIRWLNPTGSSATPTISVRDSEGTTRSSPWTIAVTTAGFKFLDATNGRSAANGGAGTFDSPWRTISDMHNSSSSAPSDIVYFRAGTYSLLDLPRTEFGPWQKYQYSDDKPNMWIAFPGQRPVIDFGFQSGVSDGGLIRLRTGNQYIDGFDTRNSRVIGFQLPSGQYNVLRRLRMRDHNIIRANLDGQNASMVMTMSSYSDSDAGGSPSTWGQYFTIQDCEFQNAPADMALKIYSQWKMLIEDNTFRDMWIGAELKSDMSQFTYRHNRHYNVPTKGVGGNMHSLTTHGEILFNLIYDPNSMAVLDLNQDSMARRIDIYRNTFVGRVRIRNTNSDDGPFRFYDNVIVNGDSGTPAGSHITHEGVSDPSRITLQNNLTGNPGSIVDAAGALNSQNAQYRGLRGWEVSTGVRPNAPTNVSVE